MSLVDLLAARLGGLAEEANDEFFAPKENLLKATAPVSYPGHYTDRGKWMDGWETRRRRVPGHDWCVLRLGVPGIVRVLVVDTTHFSGNQPESCSVEGRAEDGIWVPVLTRRPLTGDSEQTFDVDAPARVTHLRLNIFPDGGVARLRAYGEPLPDLRELADSGGRCELAGVAAGGCPVAASDTHFSSHTNLIAPGDAVDMGDGWETRRRRGPGHDWVVVRLAAESVIERVEVDTTHFKGNHPESCEVHAGAFASADPAGHTADGWRTAVARTQLHPHARHSFTVAEGQPATHVRLAIHPDGGVARLRVFGRVTGQGLQAFGLRRLNALPAEQAEGELRACCASSAWARGVAAARPFTGTDGLAATADEVWNALDRADWLEAFAAHPRIGEPAAGAWSGREQAGVGTDPDVLDRLAERNHAYEKRFGHVFLICAAGSSASEILAALERRITSDAETELRNAAEEQRKITRLRLETLLREGRGG